MLCQVSVRYLICEIISLRSPKEVQETKEPVFLTKNGVGSIVVMSMDAYEEGRYESQVYDKLLEAEIQAVSTSRRVSHEEVMRSARERLKQAEGDRRA